MKKLFMIIGVVAVGAAVFHFGCSRENRDEAVRRLNNAGKALNDTCSNAGDGDVVPAIVAEQQRRERVRQNTKWTKENQANHPVEYTRAQLEQLDRHTKQMEVSAHEVAVGKSETLRIIADNETLLKNLETFLTEAKASYRQAETSNEWPVRIGGFSLTKEKAQEKIVDAAERIAPIRSKIADLKNKLVHIEKKGEWVAGEQRKIVKIRERVEDVISDQNLKSVIDGDNSIEDALNAINDSMASLGVDYNDPKIETMITPARSTKLAENFKRVMAE